MADEKQQRLQMMRDAPEEAAPDLPPDDAPEIEQGAPRLPQPCPVTPLGMLGSKIVFLDGLRQVEIASCECRKGDMIAWFGEDYLMTYYGPDADSKSKERWDQRAAQADLVMDCRGKGIFNPQGKVLGRGAHRPLLADDTLVLHIGREVLISRGGNSKVERHPAGMVNLGGRDLFFPAADSLPRPADQPARKQEAWALLALFGTWNWAEPGLERDMHGQKVKMGAPLLLLGWVAQAFICGAFDWRAHVWLPGPTACGKSTLQRLIRTILDQDWCLSTADASEASIRQILVSDTLPVSIDEAEAHDNPAKLQAVLNLMKKASSGDKILRGSTDHKGQEFTAQSAFLLSSVLHATLRGEDRNRIALLELLPLAHNPEPLDMEMQRWSAAGRRLQRRMIEQWPRFERTLAQYRRKIGERRFEGRWQDTYGTLLACADLLLYDNAPDDLAPDDDPGETRITEAVTSIMPLLVKGKVEARTDTDRAIQHLLSKPLPGEPGKSPESVGVWLDRAMELIAVDDPNQFATDGDKFVVNERARGKLKAHGLRVVQLVDKPTDSDPQRKGIADALTGDEGWKTGYLAFAYATNAALQELWKGTEWQGDGYLQSLRKSTTIERPTVGPKKVRFGGSSVDNALLVPLDVFRGDEG